MARVSTVPHYHAVFSDICANRFQKLSRFVFTTTWLLTVIVAIPSSLSWWNTLLPFRAVPIALGFFLLTCLRKNNLHVDFLGYKTLAAQIIGQLLSKRFVYNLIFYSLSSTLFFWTLHYQFEHLELQATALKHQYPPLNDKYVYFYFLASFIGFSFALKHTVLDHDRLVFTYGNFHAHPKQTLLDNIPKIVSNTILFTITNITTAPLVYIFLRYILYDIVFFVFGQFIPLNQNYPPISFLSIGFLLKTTIVIFLLILCLETVNVAFNAYLSIGCLHRGHTLSELSTDPLETLLTGLKSTKPFTKMTAFQELAYISKINNLEGRALIYNSTNYKKNIWLEIFKECEKVIKENNSQISTVLLSELKTSTPLVTRIKLQQEENSIFGREYYTEKTKHHYNLNPTLQESDQSTFLDNNIIVLVLNHIKDSMALIHSYYWRFVTSGVGIPFRYTTRREAERLTPLPNIVGNAIIAVSLLATHAYEEDKKGTVSSTIVEILEVLEKSVRTCGKFMSHPPKGLFNDGDENIISLMHELSMNAFFEVTLKYEVVLKDVVLSPDVLALANWCLEQAYNDELQV